MLRCVAASECPLVFAIFCEVQSLSVAKVKVDVHALQTFLQGLVRAQPVADSPNPEDGLD